MPIEPDRSSPTRREFLTTLAGAAALGLAPRAERPPNIVFIFSDDHAWQAVSAYGGGLNHTPNIDRIGREGIRLDACLVPNSICAPSRATVLTGKYSHLNGVRDNAETFDGAQPTFPKLLRAAGYETRVVEFVPSQHTPKNTLIRAMRRGVPDEDAKRQYVALRDATGGAGISLARTMGS